VWKRGKDNNDMDILGNKPMAPYGRNITRGNREGENVKEGRGKKKGTLGYKGKINAKGEKGKGRVCVRSQCWQGETHFF
jgi:hypothetical protein